MGHFSSNRQLSDPYIQTHLVQTLKSTVENGRYISTEGKQVEYNKILFIWLCRKSACIMSGTSDQEIEPEATLNSIS